MSALGQKQTCAVQKGMSALPPKATAKADMPQMVMSALPPKADSCSATANVCFGPIADIQATMKRSYLGFQTNTAVRDKREQLEHYVPV